MTGATRGGIRSSGSSPLTRPAGLTEILGSVTDRAGGLLHAFLLRAAGVLAMVLYRRTRKTPIVARYQPPPPAPVVYLKQTFIFRYAICFYISSACGRSSTHKYEMKIDVHGAHGGHQRRTGAAQVYAVDRAVEILRHPIPRRVDVLYNLLPWS